MNERQLIRVGHSPDPDDAFMFYALAKDCIPTGNLKFQHSLVDIETLNHDAFQGYYELTALSLHAYAYLHEKYILCPCGASMGDMYGPMLVARSQMSYSEQKKAVVAVPGKLTTAFLALSMYLDGPFNYILVPFHLILDAVQNGEYEGKHVDAGLIIHEGQLTYGTQDLKLLVDTGIWWQEKTGLPLPLGANGVRRDLGPDTIQQVNRLLKESILYGLDHRHQALAYALQYGRGLDTKLADQFIGMYVNDWTLDFGTRGRTAVRELLRLGYECGVIPELVIPEFVT